VDERRATPRTRLGATVTCRVAADPPFSATIQDVSARGLSLLTSLALPRRAPIWVEAPGKPALALLVAHSTPLPDGVWLIGCELLDPGDGAALAGLLQPAG
jgi:hypothetical protein